MRASEQAAREAEPAEDANPLVEGPAAAGLRRADRSRRRPTSSPALARDLGDAFSAARGDGLSLYGYASHDTTTVWLGSSTGLRLRHVQPTGYVEVTGKSSGGSSWVGRHTRDWSDVTVAVARQRGAAPTGLGRAAARAAGRALRDAAAAVGGRRPHGLRLLDGVGPQRRRGPDGVQQAGRRHAGRRAPRPGRAADDLRPARPGARHRAVRRRERVVGDEQRLRQRPAAAAHRLDGATARCRRWCRPARRRRTSGAPGDAVRPQPRASTAGGTASTEEMVARTERGLLLTCLWYIREVDPQTLLLTGPDARRRLPRRGRRGRRAR